MPDSVARDDADQAFARHGARIELERISLDHFETAGVMVGDLGESRQAAAVALDGDDLLRARRQDGTGEAARAGADFDDGGFLQRTRRAGDAACEV